MTTYIQVRRYPRFPVSWSSRVRIGNEQEEQSQLVDLSQGGVSVLYPRHVRLGESVELLFDPDIGGQERAVYGEVRHCTPLGAQRVVGVEFKDIEPQAFETIREFIRQNLELRTSE